jgi:uncharacterized protein YeaO (DUF488 family)
MASTTLKLSTFRIGEAAAPAGALRIAATRRPPRGVPRAQWPGLFDLWFPVVAPGDDLFRRLRASLGDDRTMARLFAEYERELARPEARHVLELLAEVARRTPVAVGCFCEDESRCHRSRLKKLIERAAARS